MVMLNRKIARAAIAMGLVVVGLSLFCTVGAATSSIKEQIETQSGSFDQIMTFGSHLDPQTFDAMFAAAAARRFDTFAALAELQRSMTPLQKGQIAGHPDNGLETGIARRYTFDTNHLRVDDLNSEKSYIINCSDRSVTQLDHSSRRVVRVQLPERLLHWAGADEWVMPHVMGVQRPADSKATHISILGEKIGSAYRISIAAPGLLETQTSDTYTYSFDREMPAPPCTASDALTPAILSGVFGPNATLLLYKEQFAAYDVTAILPRNLPGNAFSSVQFFLNTFAKIEGTIIRGHPNRVIQSDSFKVPTGYTLMADNKRESGEEISSFFLRKIAIVFSFSRPSFISSLMHRELI